ncbi:CaiB/BaiF CoA transferase family protein [Jannaschia aquimarina]|uniref:BbsF_2 protein n=1 Tax=Jannaschia aquimarina TaxID=935700 RepID=A0A0D1D8M3_9RHOB|nr:CoA transferase [Jannaschia aquimarina]KIT16263.1 Succinyl-CoA:(R)-benzylsuccinate CoA-transferase subunit BbsF [Jannaschia aquimarina]SNT15010.1 Crotonobetainyl-CoA:carnitine CoA-transferase CaiB [Jannaschia aquimarina]
MTEGPLTGLRVVDFTHVLAGPACGYMLGLLGADVIKVEGPNGDAMRWRGGTDADAAKAGRSTAWLTQAAGKRSIVLDLETEFGRDAMMRLLERADILVENHLPETLRHLGLDDLTKRFPRLIHCAMTGYGRGGDLQDAPAYDVNIQAASGLMSLTGTEATGPLRAGAPVMDYATALAAGFAICAALYRRERTGEGGLVDVSMFETGLTLMASSVADMTATGRVPRARGNAANSRSPSAGTFPCREGLLSLGVNEEHQFDALARALGRDDWLADPRFATRAARGQNGAALEQALLAALSERDATDWESILRAAGVPAAELRGLDAALALPQVDARGFLADIGGVHVPTLPFRIGEHAPRPSGPPRELGVDTDEILAELGLVQKART